MAENAQLALVIVVGILLFAALFRPEMRKKLGDLRTFTFPGGSADLTGEQATKRIEEQNNSAPKPEVLPAPRSEAAGLPVLPAASPVYLPIETDLRQRIEAALPGAIDAQMNWALRVAAVAQVERDHEQTYRVIFGSQIFARKELNIRGAMTVAQVRDQVYALPMKSYPDAFDPDGFDAWGRFIVTRGLAVLSDDLESADENTRVALSPLGKDFLMFVTGRGLSDMKWG